MNEPPITQGTIDKDKLYTIRMNEKLFKYGMCLINGELTTIDINLKKH